MHINKSDFYPKLTPEMQQVVDYIRAWNEAHPPTADYRQDYLDERIFWNEDGPTPAKVLNETVDGPHGAIPVRIIYPALPEQTKRITVYLHGGSFMLGNNDTHDKVMRIFAEESGTVVIGVDYRLAPEHKFPSWIEESTAVIRYFHQNAEKYGLDGNDISLCGDSAGAMMCLSSALWLRDKDGDTSYLTALVLYYGAYGMRDGTSFRLWGNEVDAIMREEMGLWPTATLEKQEDMRDPYYDLLSNDLTHDVPPCFICCGTADPLLDNSTVLYEILKDKGIPCELKLYPGVMHAFIHYNRMMADARESLHLGGQYVRKQKKS